MSNIKNRQQPSIPSVPNSVPADMRQFLNALRTSVQTLQGDGNTNANLDRAVTLRELSSSKLPINFNSIVSALSSGGRNVRTGGSDSSNTEIDLFGITVEYPKKPTGVQASIGLTTSILSWDTPTYAGHSYTEVFRQKVNLDSDGNPVSVPEFNEETMKHGTSSSSVFTESVDYNAGYYYWVRHVNIKGQKSPIHATQGVFAKNVIEIDGSLIRKGTIIGDRIATGTIGEENMKDLTERPIAPAEFAADMALSTCILTWKPAEYVGHDYTKIYRVEVELNSRGEPVSQPTFNAESMYHKDITGNVYSETVDPEKGYIYWIRHINVKGVEGPLSQPVTAKNWLQLDKKLLKDDTVTPPAVTGIRGNATLTNAIVTWDPAKYPGHSHTEVYRTTSTSDSTFPTLNTGTMFIKNVDGSLFSEVADPSTGYVYWLRHVNINNVKGPISNPVRAKNWTQLDKDFLVDDTESPTKPTGVNANIGLTMAIVYWDPPTYKGHSHSLVYRLEVDAELGTSPAFSSAYFWKKSTSNIISETIDFKKGYYYWVRHVNINGVEGPVNAVNGAFAKNNVQIDGSLVRTGSIVSDHIATGSVVADKISSGSITSEKIKAGAITSEKITSGAVVADKIAALAIGSDKIQSNAIDSSKISAGAITSDKITSGAVVSDKIAAGAVVSGKLAAGSITSDKLTSGSILTDHLASGSVTALKIAGGTITGDKIAAGTITGGKIAAGQVIVTPVIQAGTISGGNININNRFIVDGNGQVSIRGSNQNVGLVITNETIYVYDESGRVRVKIGKLR